MKTVIFVNFKPKNEAYQCISAENYPRTSNVQNSSKNPNPDSKFDLATSGATSVPVGHQLKSAEIVNFPKTQNSRFSILAANCNFGI